ncbi:non-homologous end-joining DNA ligase [Lapillicoccus jejuensis]|uniref:DNA ligase D n=1 Tax=Lapillicoccus jejuensis TaxID=402171 RepID=A0A542E5E2_9MICO|nr:non-homologous end-joining DNA ligase [Lapillicoccus jejuensis]TQJ10550.1 DNA ligase D [Lapillicoccus jejuensis]
MASDATVLEVEGPDGPRRVRVSSPDRVMWPDAGITKLDLARYVVAVGDRFLALAGHRPVTLQRFPQGIDGEMFYAKNPPKGAPAWSRSVTVTYPSGRSHPQLVVDEVATAVWAVQMNTVTFHPWPVTAPPGLDAEASSQDGPGPLDRPDEVRLDLDPQPGRPFADVVEAALALRGVMQDAGLAPYAKTTGSRGVHVYARVQPEHEFLDVRHGVIAIARELERRLPDLVTTAWWKEERGDKVFVDFNQACRDRTIASAYSPRPLPGAPVSMPVAWDDLPRVSMADFTVRTVPGLVDSRPDPWASYGGSSASLTTALGWWERDLADGLGELSFPPDYPKMPGEPPRVQPSKQRYDDAEYLGSDGGYLRDNPQEPPGGWEAAKRRRASRGPRTRP